MCDESQRQQDTSLRRTTILFFATLVVLVSGTSAALCWGGKCRVRMRQSGDDTKDPVVARGVRNDTVAEILDDAIGDASFNQRDGEMMHSNTSAQALASEWSIFRDPLRNVLLPQRITQRYALATLFFQPGEWRSVDPSWLSGENECGWFGVECDEDNLVTAIQIPGIFLSQYESSFIPTDRKLSTFIGPSAPMLVPAIPSDLAILTRLRILDLSQNSIRGPLPETLSNLTLMEVFNVSGNEMEGALPNLNWPNLKSFSITGFTEGPLPEWIGQWTDLEKFEITSVTFTGTLPSSMALWTNMRHIVVYENTFSGSFPTNLANLSLLEHLEVSDSFFELPFPSDVIHWPKLKVLRLENLSFNNNEIPTSLATLTDLECLSLHASNDKSAIVPIGDWPKLKELYLDGNGLSAAGGLPGKATWTNLIDYCAFSDFTGELPHYIGLWTSLETFNVRRNSLSGSIPTEFGLCTNLRYLFVEGNFLTGSIPSEIGELGSLEEFAIGQNSISGPIPNARSWTNLKFLSLDGNLLTGPIPDSVKAGHR